MRLFEELLYRLRALLRRADLESELDEELRFHVERETEKLVREEGLEPAEARRRALVAFGGVEQAKEGAREARGVGLVDVLARDVRFALRGMRKSPIFAGTLVLVLGLAIGADSAMFAVADALLLRPLPYGEPGELVEVWRASEEGYTGPIHRLDAARRWSEEAEFLDGALLNVRRSVLYLGGAEPQTVPVQAVGPNFEEVLRVRPALGRGFTAGDAEPGSPPTTILSHDFWRTAFGADTAVLGRTIELDGRPHRVIGVMPEGFKFPTYAHTDAWIPLYADDTVLGDAVGFGAYLVGRLAGQGIEAAQARADALATALEERASSGYGWTVRLEPFRDANGPNDDARQAMALLGAAVALILLIAGANAVHLLLVRGWARGRELAVRRALGASRGRLIRQMLTESGLLAMASGVVAVVTALVTLRAIQGIMPGSITFFTPHAIGVEQRTLVFTFALAAVAGALVGAIPALRATRVDAAAAGAGLTPYAAVTPAKGRLRRGLLVAEVALSVLLLVGAGLLVRSFVGLTTVDPGFRVDDITVLELSLPSENYPTGADRGAFLERLDERLEALPGVEGVAVGAGVPPAHGLHISPEIETESGPAPEEGTPTVLPSGYAAPDFFDVLDVDVVAGRRLTAGDAGTDRVLVDVDLARFLWDDESPVGRRFRMDGAGYTVVGVVEDLAMEGPDDRSGDFELLFPYDPASPPRFVSLAIRTRGEPGPLTPAIRDAVHELDPHQPIGELAPATTLYAETFDLPRFLLVLMSILSGLALVLTAVGIAGVLAFGVSQRRHEFGVRIALGARPIQLSGTVLREGIALAALGTVIGSAGALALARLIRGLLFQVEPTDPGTFAAVVLVSIAAAGLACWWPARRASRVDPISVLKVE